MYECVEIVGESFVVAHDACLFLSACGQRLECGEIEGES